MDKRELIRTLRIEHETLRATIDELTDAELAQPAQGEWTRRDLVAHIEWWERHCTHVIGALRGGRDPYPTVEPFDLDAANARVFEENRGRTAADVRAGEASAWADLLAAIQGADEADLFEPGRFAWTEGDPLAEIIHGNTDRHWVEHLPQLQMAAADEVGGHADGAD